ncbi:hypothetical protein PENTCL1PPCAC_13217, partial [Pristionchus entomophagus]
IIGLLYHPSTVTFRKNVEGWVTVGYCSLSLAGFLAAARNLADLLGAASTLALVGVALRGRARIGRRLGSLGHSSVLPLLTASGAVVRGAEPSLAHLIDHRLRGCDGDRGDEHARTVDASRGEMNRHEVGRQFALPNLRHLFSLGLQNLPEVDRLITGLLLDTALILEVALLRLLLGAGLALLFVVLLSVLRRGSDGCSLLIQAL